MVTHTLQRSFVGLVATTTLLIAAGCLRTEKAHTLYVAGDGTVTWTVVEKDVRSDDRDPAKAAAEEHEYLSRARAGTHAVAAAFVRLSALNVTTLIVRERRPFTVVTTAQFPSLQVLGQGLIDAMGLNASSELTHESAHSRWTLTIRSDEVAEGAGEDLAALFDEPWHVVLERGRFVDARNVRLADEQRAILDQGEEDPEPGRPLVWSLSWTR